MKELLITFTFLRPAVDAYRVSTNHVDEDSKVDTLTETIMSKVVEMATESIPSCVLQLYVWLENPNEAGKCAFNAERHKGAKRLVVVIVATPRHFAPLACRSPIVEP